MRDYLKEIRELERNIERLNAEYSEKFSEKFYIQGYLNRFDIGDKSLSEILGVSGTDRYLLSQLHERRHELRHTMDLIQIDIDRLRKKIIKLKEAYKQDYIKQHSVEYFCPMDEIDIRNLISKDGYIIGVKF